jgi:hypothetical protein
MVNRLIVLGALVTAALAAAPAWADEAKVMVKASMLLSITSIPLEARETAYDRTLKEAGPTPRAAVVEARPDGSLKIDRAVITVRNPCPPGSMMDHDPALPGRRAKN